MKKPDVISVHGLDVEYCAWPAHRGHRDKYGCPEEPDEPADFEVQQVLYKDINIDEVIEEFDGWDTLNSWVEEALAELALENDDDGQYADYCWELEKDRRMGL